MEWRNIDVIIKNVVHIVQEFLQIKNMAPCIIGGNLTATYIRILWRIACARVDARTLGTYGLVTIKKASSLKQHTINKYYDKSSTFLQNTRQTFPYTVLLVGTCTRSWKTTEFMLVPASELVTSLAWYSRTLRMRRGPSTNICTGNKIW